MKKILITFTALLVTAGWSWGASTIGSVELLEGIATAKNGPDPVRSLAIGSEIYLNDTVATGPDSKVQLRFIDNSMVAQGEQGILHIDEYVYNPKKKAENGSAFRAVKGVFRIITDQITKLNPERFLVDTQSGTIGIRGCEVGIDLTGVDEKVFIIGLGDVDSVVVGLKGNAAKGVKADETVVSQTGVGVTLAKTGLSRFKFDAGAVKLLNVRTTPELAAMSTVAPEESSSSQTEVQEVSESSEEGEEAPPVWAATDQLASDFGQNVDQQVEDFVADVEADLDDQQDTATPPDGTAEEMMREGEEEVTSTTTVGPKNNLASGAGANWSWGVWDRDVTTAFADGSSTMSKRIGVDASGNMLSAAEYSELSMFAGPPALLTGSGMAGAVIMDGSMTAAVTGSATIRALVGNATPFWDATVNLNGGPNTLNFLAGGGFSSSGKMTGGLTAYNLNAFGNSYGTPAGQSFDGKLVKSTGAVSPIVPTDISGAVVEFGFDHAGGPSVRGAAGSDF